MISWLAIPPFLHVDDDLAVFIIMRTNLLVRVLLCLLFHPCKQCRDGTLSPVGWIRWLSTWIHSHCRVSHDFLPTIKDFIFEAISLKQLDMHGVCAPPHDTKKKLCVCSAWARVTPHIAEDEAFCRAFPCARAP